MASTNKSPCSKCGTGNLVDSSFCFRCGNKLKEQSNNQTSQYVTTSNTQGSSTVNKFGCTKCGNDNLIGSSFCSKCGNELKEPLQKNQMSQYVKTPTTSDLHSKTFETKSEFKSIQSDSDTQKNLSSSDEKPRKIVYGVFRCKNEHKEFSVTIEEISSGIWSMTKTSPIQSGLKAYNEKLDIEGTFQNDNYDGCPYCSAPGVIHCFCGRIFCWDSRTEQNKCPWCNEIGTISGAFHNIKAGADV